MLPTLFCILKFGQAADAAPADAATGLLFRGALGSLAPCVSPSHPIRSFLRASTFNIHRLHGRFEDMSRLSSAAKICTVVVGVFPFERAQEAFEALAGQVHFGKIVIRVSE